jgi:hypothetical protein
MTHEPPSSNALPHLDLAFIHRVYRTSLVLALLGALCVWARFGVPAALGWLAGTGLQLLVIAGVEWTVLRLLGKSRVSLAAVSLLKLAAAAGVLLLALLAPRWGRASLVLFLIGVLAGFSLPLMVMGLKLLGQALQRASGRGKR